LFLIVTYETKKINIALCSTNLLDVFINAVIYRKMLELLRSNLRMYFNHTIQFIYKILHIITYLHSDTPADHILSSCGSGLENFELITNNKLYTQYK